MSTRAESVSFRCRRRLGTGAFYVLFTVLLAVLLTRAAYTNKDVLVIGRMVRLSVGATTVTLWVLAGASAFFVYSTVRSVCRQVLHGVPDVTLSDQAISFPVEFPDRVLVLAYRDIRQISLTKALAEKILVLRMAADEHRFSLDWLKNKEDEQPLVHELEERWSAALREAMKEC